jgi:hypothetical protein
MQDVQVQYALIAQASVSTLLSPFRLSLRFIPARGKKISLVLRNLSSFRFLSDLLLTFVLSSLPPSDSVASLRPQWLHERILSTVSMRKWAG